MRGEQVGGRERLARYRHHDYSQGKFIPLQFDKQILSGSFEHTLHHLIDEELDLSAFDDKYRNDDTGAPLTLELQTGNLPKRSCIKISQIRTLSTERIGKLLGRVSEEELEQVIEGLNEIIA